MKEGHNIEVLINRPCVPLSLVINLFCHSWWYFDPLIVSEKQIVYRISSYN